MANKSESCSLIQRVWRAAAESPNKTVIRDAQGDTSWSELLWRANTIAKDFDQFDSDRSRLPYVPILVDRSANTIVAILASLISGRGFAPLNPAQPLARLQHCFKALGATAYVCFDDAQELTDGKLERLRLSQASAAPGLPARPSDPQLDQPLYVLFTSGSTGVPKGVLANYSNIENTLLWSAELLDWRATDVIGCCTNFFFDISIFDVFSSLWFNQTLAIYSEPSNLAKVIDETRIFGITTVFGVPTFFSQFVRQGKLQQLHDSQLRRIISGGDFFPPIHVLHWMESLPQVKIFNVWGPTETSIVNTMHAVSEADIAALRQGRAAPVGRSMPRMPLVLIDEECNNINEANQTGEICMLGACVTQGYLADHEKTQQFYIEIDGQRGFRTQDLGFVDDDGKLHIVGRTGSTVKVSGYRINLGEVESAATTLESIHQACCSVFDDNKGRQELWMAIVPTQPEKKLDIYGIKKQLRTCLSTYMVPKRIIVMSELPVNENGKIHRQEVAKRMFT